MRGVNPDRMRVWSCFDQDGKRDHLGRSGVTAEAAAGREPGAGWSEHPSQATFEKVHLLPSVTDEQLTFSPHARLAPHRSHSRHPGALQCWVLVEALSSLIPCPPCQPRA